VQFVALCCSALFILPWVTVDCFCFHSTVRNVCVCVRARALN
jgi:hypothetical protein